MLGFGLYEDGFDRMVVFTGPIFWSFLLMTGLALFVLRHREPATTRPCRVVFYPWTPVLFCASTAYLLYASVSYAWQQHHVEGLRAAAAMAAGAVWARYDGRTPAPASRSTS